MRGGIGHVVGFVVIFGLGWLSGDRYGAPEWMAGLAGKGFAAVESAAGGALNAVLDSAGVETDDPAAPEPSDEEAAEETETVDLGGLEENRGLRINEAAMRIIKESETLRLTPVTIQGQTFVGYGHQVQPGESFTKISEREAEKLLRRDLAYYEAGVREILTQPATENQFSAMVSFAHNKGLSAFVTSDVVQRFNAGDIDAAANDFRRHTGTGGPTPHLVERRERERMLFLKDI